MSYRNGSPILIIPVKIKNMHTAQKEKYIKMLDHS